jgi:Protein of unknown function (DUF3455)
MQEFPSLQWQYCWQRVPAASKHQTFRRRLPFRVATRHSSIPWAPVKSPMNAASRPIRPAHTLGHSSHRTLTDRDNKTVGSYFNVPPTWQANDGSQVVGKQLAISPAPAGNIPLQLVQAASYKGEGAMKSVTYIQRLNTVGGVAPSDTCDAGKVGTKKQVKYKADYLMYKAS